jgi:hypothetical protein
MAPDRLVYDLQQNPLKRKRTSLKDGRMLCLATSSNSLWFMSYCVWYVCLRNHLRRCSLVCSVGRDANTHACVNVCTCVGMKLLVLVPSRSVKKRRLFCGKEKLNILGFPSWKRSAAVGKVVQTLGTYVRAHMSHKNSVVDLCIWSFLTDWVERTCEYV